MDVDAVLLQLRMIIKDGTTETCATLYDKDGSLNTMVTGTPSEFGVSLSAAAPSQKVSGVVNAPLMSIGDKIL